MESKRYTSANIGHKHREKYKNIAVTKHNPGPSKERKHAQSKSHKIKIKSNQIHSHHWFSSRTSTDDTPLRYGGMCVGDATGGGTPRSTRHTFCARAYAATAVLLGAFWCIVRTSSTLPSPAPPAFQLAEHDVSSLLSDSDSSSGSGAARCLCL